MRKFKLLFWLPVLAVLTLACSRPSMAAVTVRTGTNYQYTQAIENILIASGVNWSISGNQLNLYGTNWANINSINTLSAINWNLVALPHQSINWYQVTGGPVAVNWTGAYLSNSGVNWYDMQAQQLVQGTATGINWNDLNPSAGGINWMVVTKQAADNTILCVKGGQLGRCTSGFSASSAGSCNCQ